MNYLCENGFFSGINSYSGFVPMLEKLTKDCEKLYILKGTPGCGKSTLLKRLYMRGKRLGKVSIPVKCSADNASFDGVIFPELSSAVIDGTAPHTVEPILPQIRDKIIDISGDLNDAVTQKYRDTLTKLAESKSKCYADAYSLLAAAGKIKQVIEKTARRCIDSDKLGHCAARTVSRYAVSCGNVYVLPCACFNGDGIGLILPSDDRELIYVSGRYGTDAILLEQIERACADAGKTVGVIPSPLDPNVPCGLVFDKATLVSDIFINLRTNRRINTARFLRKDLIIPDKTRLCTLEKLHAKLTGEAACFMREAMGYHKQIEAVYSLFADFSYADSAYIKIAAGIFGE